MYVTVICPKNLKVASTFKFQAHHHNNVQTVLIHNLKWFGLVKFQCHFLDSCTVAVKLIHYFAGEKMLIILRQQTKHVNFKLQVQYLLNPYQLFGIYLNNTYLFKCICMILQLAFHVNAILPVQVVCVRKFDRMSVQKEAC